MAAFENHVHSDIVQYWYNLLKQFLRISPTKFAILFSSEYIKRENSNLKKKINFLVRLVYFTQETRPSHVRCLHFSFLDFLNYLYINWARFHNLCMKHASSLYRVSWTSATLIKNLSNQAAAFFNQSFSSRIFPLILETKGYVTRMISPRGDFHPWVDFAPVSGQTYLSVYMFNRGEISPLFFFRPCLQDKGETHPRGNSAWF